MLEFLVEQKHRIPACNMSRFLFALYYFEHYFTFPSAPFHKLWAIDFSNDDLKGYINLGFRESAKTAWSKIDIIHDICYQKTKYTLWISQDSKKGDRNLFDIITELQYNSRIIEDFGCLYLPDESTKRTDVRVKTKGRFKTENGIMIESVGATGSLRGFTFGKFRPDKLRFDDIENNKTKKSAIVTQNTIDFIDEALAGKVSTARVYFNVNYISDYGVVKYLLDKAEKNPKTWKISWINAEENGVPTWADKYTMTDAEAVEFNKHIADKRLHKESLENKKRELGESVYNQEMMNQPASKGERFFDLKKIDARIEELKGIKWQSTKKFKEGEDDLEPVKDFYEEKGGWKIWGGYVKHIRYGIVADVAEGYGNDSSVIQAWDLDNGILVKEYESRSIAPSLLGKMIADEGKLAFYSIVCPERNSIGIAVVDAIKNENYQQMYREKSIDTITLKPIFKYGWHTNSKTKPLMLFEFKKDFEDGLITINSIPLLREMRLFTNDEVTNNSASDPLVSKHFDRLMTACIGWQMRKVNQIKGFLT